MHAAHHTNAVPSFRRAALALAVAAALGSGPLLADNVTGSGNIYTGGDT